MTEIHGVPGGLRWGVCDANEESFQRMVAAMGYERQPSSASADCSTSFEVGDLVEAIPPWALACGSGIYQRAVMVSITPFVAVSEAGDMLWRATIKPEKVRRIGKALPEVIDVAMKRFNSGQ